MSTVADNPSWGPFSVRSYRLQWPADLTTSWAFEMETLILGWYVLVETESVLMLTLFASLQYLGTLVAPMFGVVGDRIGHGNLLCMMRGFYGLLAATLMTLAFSGVLVPWHVFVIAALTGMVRPSDLVMRASLVGETMPANLWMKAMSISRTTMDSARIAGAIAGAGLAATLGMGPAYAVVATLYTASFFLTRQVALDATSKRALRDAAKAAELQSPSQSPSQSSPQSSPWRDLRDGFAHVWNTPQLLAVMWLAFLVNLAGFPLVNGLMPYVAKEIHQTGQAGLAWLVASSAFGALIGSLTLSRIGGLFAPARMMIVSAIAWFVMLMVFAQMKEATSGMMVLVCSGFVQSLTMVVMSTVLLRITDQKFRGRIMGIRMFAIYGLPIGLLASGPLITHVGYTAMATLYCTIGILFTVLIAFRWRRDLWHAAAPANRISGIS